MIRAFTPVPRSRGFTWIETIIVLAVVGILALMAIPSMQESALKGQVKEGLAIADLAKKGVQGAYYATRDMPADNKAAGIPERTKIVASLVKEVNVDAGAITLTYGNNASKALDGLKLTLRPAVVPDEPVVPIAWICHDNQVPKNMEARGKDETDIPSKWLPLECRNTAPK